MDTQKKKDQKEAPKSDDVGGTGDAKPVVATAATQTPKTPASGSGRKPLGAKEVIPFRWKLVGETPGAVLTLIKATEREEVDAHLERVQKEGYYKGLRVLDIDAKITQPKPPAPPKKASRRARRTPKTAPKVTAKAGKKTKRTSKAASSSSRKPAAKKSHAKSAPKTTKKKPAPSKPTTRRSTRKKKA